MSKILVVEDDLEMNTYVVMALRLEGYEVLAAHDGVSALEQVEEFAPDLILSDVEMPQMGGLALARELQKNRATATIPIIFVTGRHELESRVQGLEYGIDYVVKPFATPELLARVRAALRIRKLENDLRATNEQFAVTNRELEKVNARLEQLALTDELTHVCNRRGLDKNFEDELRRAQRLGTPVAFLMFDLDHFKKINDTWGHAQGDAVLQEFARLLRASSRHIDTVARFGGEEFAVVLPHTDLEGAQAFAEKARAATEAMLVPRVTPDAESLSPLRVTASGGGAVLETVPGDISIEPLYSGLIQVADTFLYQAKQNGRNRVIVQGATLDQVVAPGRISAPSS
jgi:two-component system cell cycle response regulator